MKKNKTKSVRPLTEEEQNLVEKYYPFAMKIGLRYAGLGAFKGIPVEDLQQEACFGLCIAAQRFRPEEGVDFRAYAKDWCCRYVMNAIDGEAETVEDDVEVLESEILDDLAERQERAQKVEALMSRLNEKERQVIFLIYGFETNPKDFKQVARKLRLTTQRVHQIYDGAMAKMEWKAFSKSLNKDF